MFSRRLQARRVLRARVFVGWARHSAVAFSCDAGTDLVDRPPWIVVPRLSGGDERTYGEAPYKGASIMRKEIFFSPEKSVFFVVE